ncbi:TrbG/VirB9 family P-type conjugative transfer protein [Pseudomonas cedrina]|uniref:TrbG/VirB9 family P-type conjugative transfer protein n=1 Tax=Pseudomonas cedrina TaxID=651740 RepID=UPI003ED9E2BD
MQIKSFLFILALGTVPILDTQAAQVPIASKQDARVRFVDFDPYNIVTVKAKIGRDTLVIFSKGERIEDMGGGYTDAWGVGTMVQQNGFFIKPTRNSPATNIHIVTNKRIYNLDMVLAQGKETNYEFVVFRYPEDDLMAKKAAANSELAKKYLSYGDGKNLNKNYTVEGSSTISPEHVEDDGLATYVRFPARGELPQVYYVNEEGNEVQATFNMKNDVMVIHAVQPKFIFRRGELVTCLYNESYDPRGGKRPTTNTTSPKVERVLKETK